MPGDSATHVGRLSQRRSFDLHSQQVIISKFIQHRRYNPKACSRFRPIDRCLSKPSMRVTRCLHQRTHQRTAPPRISASIRMPNIVPNDSSMDRRGGRGSCSPPVSSPHRSGCPRGPQGSLILEPHREWLHDDILDAPQPRCALGARLRNLDIYRVWHTDDHSGDIPRHAGS